MHDPIMITLYKILANNNVKCVNLKVQVAIDLLVEIVKR